KPLRLLVLHQVGECWLERYRHLEEDGYRIAGFVDAPLAMSAADLLLARAGAGTLAEAAYHRLPALLFPLSPSLDGGAQAANAQAYRQA
ncbi:glycosyltransferase, partial [Acinetobacter baumannii]